MTVRRTEKYLIFLFLTFLACLVGSILLLSSVPPVSRDALTHHLFVPRLYIEHGGIYEIPSLPFSYYPMNLDLLYMIPLYLGNDIVPKYIHFLFALLTAWLIYDYLSKRISSLYGLLGSLFFLSIPIIVKLSITVYVDLGLMFFTTASLLLLFRWLNSKYKTRYLVLAGICCGLAAGTKYNGLIAFFLLSLFIPVLYIRSQTQNRRKTSSGKAAGFGLLFVLASLLAFSPWLIRNTLWTGNPIYPLYNSLFQWTSGKAADKGHPTRKNTEEIVRKITSRGSGVFATRKILYHETWWQALLLPIRFFFEGKDDDPQYFDGKLNPFLFLLPFFAFSRKSTNRCLQLEKYTLVAFAGLFFFFTFFQEALRIRYIVSIIPSLTLLSIFGLKNIFSITSEIQSILTKRYLMLLCLSLPAAMLACNGRYIVQQFQYVQPLSYILGNVDRKQYITRFRPEYPVIQYANDHLNRDANVLCIFLGNRGYYMSFTPIFDMPMRGGILTGILSSASQGKNIKSELLHRNISHILLREDLTQNWFQHLNPGDQEKVASFFHYDTKKLYSSGGYSFLRILSKTKPFDHSPGR